MDGIYGYTAKYFESLHTMGDHYPDLFRRLTMISAVQQVRKTEEDTMTESQAKTYLEELGLAKSYNAVLDYEGETRMDLRQSICRRLCLRQTGGVR